MSNKVCGSCGKDIGRGAYLFSKEKKHYHPKCFSGKNKDIEEVTSKSSVKTIPINVPEYDTSASVDEDIIADIIEENKIGTLGRHKRTKRDDD